MMDAQVITTKTKRGGWIQRIEEIVGIVLKFTLDVI